MDSTIGHDLMSFMDAFSGYNQIRMSTAGEEKTAFVTDQRLYCYHVMSFELKNTGATYQRLVNKLFKPLIGKMMEVYIDDMITKYVEQAEHTTHLRKTFEVLQKIR